MIRNPKLWFIISLVTIGASILLTAALGLVWGVDFIGGTLVEITAGADQAPAAQQLIETRFNLPAQIQTTPEGTLIIRMNRVDDAKLREIVQALKENQVTSEEPLRSEIVGPTIGQELRRKSTIAVILSVIAMILYLAYEFRKVRGLTAPWKFGVAAAYALIHDLLVVTALFAILGKWLQVPIDSLFVTAQLAIMGYSVNDTIVLFNRFKVEWARHRNKGLAEVMDIAAWATLMRSLNTALGTLVMLVTILLLGGTTVRWFVVALTAGIVSGTYSSIFVAAPALYYLSRRR